MADTSSEVTGTQMNPRNDKTRKQEAGHPAHSRTHSPARNIEDVSICAECECDMVYPIDWEQEQSDNRLWRVTLRCPNCEGVRDGLMDEDLIEKFDCLLDRGTDSLVRDLRNLTYANMATEINVFVSALDGGHLLPEDF